MRTGKLLLWLLVGLVLPTWTAGEEVHPQVDLTKLTLEELMNLEVTLVSRKPEPLAQTTAAIAVLTAEDLRRCGVRSLPEALRLIPGMQVARIDANKWAVTSRGFGSLWANKLLVQIDGRSIYNPLFSGVFWESQDVVLEDVEQIEVIRGPGGALWGANAVNGIINIVTKRASDIQGPLIQVGAGAQERGFGTVQYGGRLGSKAHFRVSVKYFDRGHSSGPDGAERADGWHVTRGGGRVDWQASSRDEVSLQADAYAGRAGQSFAPVVSLSPPRTADVEYAAQVKGGSALGRWTRDLAGGSQFTLQLYYDRFQRRDWPTSGVIHTGDADFQHRVSLSQRQELLWGLGYRFTTDEFDSTLMMSLQPPARSAHLLSGFAQDDVELVPERLRLTVGSKLEHHTYTGFEVQPNVRLGWSPSPRHLFWTAVSRAVRTPSRADEDIRTIPRVLPAGAVTPGSPGTIVLLLGNRQFRSEVLQAVEGGYRTAFREWLTADLSCFYNRYTRLRSMEPEPEYHQDSVLVFPRRLENLLEGRAYGTELAAAWQPASRWRLQAAYTFLHLVLKARRESLDLESPTWAGDNPRHQFNLRSYLDLPGHLELNLVGRYVDRLSSMDIPAYFTGDVRLGWRPTPSLEASLTGQHLLESPHLEYISSSSTTLPSQVEAGVYGMLTWNARP